MGKKTEELISTLDEIESLLIKEGHWLKLISSANRRIKNSDYSGIELLLSYYGGMGSFSDLVICQPSGEGALKWSNEAKAKNDNLARLRSKAYELSNNIKHNHETNA